MSVPVKPVMHLQAPEGSADEYDALVGQVTRVPHVAVQAVPTQVVVPV